MSNVVGQLVGLGMVQWYVMNLCRWERVGASCNLEKGSMSTRCTPCSGCHGVYQSLGGAGAHLSGLNKLFFGFSILGESVLGTAVESVRSIRAGSPKFTPIKKKEFTQSLHCKNTVTEFTQGLHAMSKHVNQE
jgi:hypothetical protein